jgi:hypothetical protein
MAALEAGIGSEGGGTGEHSRRCASGSNIIERSSIISIEKSRRRSSMY